MEQQSDSRTRITKLAVLVLAAALMLALTACGQGGTAEGGAEGEDGTVKMGVLVPLTGELGSFGEGWRKAAELAQSQVNKVGGLPGDAKLELVVDDEATDPETALRAARRMIGSAGVSAIIGPTSGPMVAVAPEAKRAQVPVISPAAGTVELNEIGGDFVYRTVSSDDADGLSAAKFLLDRGAERVAFIAQNEESTISPARVFQVQFQDSGKDLVASVVFNAGQSSYQTVVEEVLAKDPNWIFCACGQQSGVTLLREANASGYEGNWLVTADLVSPGVIEQVGADVMEGVYGQTATSDPSLPAYKEFAQAYREKFGEEAPPFSANMYDAAMLAILAMVQSGSTEGAEINGAIRDVANPPGTEVSSYEDALAALEEDEDINYEGASGPVDLDKTGTASSPYSIQQVQNGEWKQVEFYPASVFVDREVSSE
jgi:ABC-type branched-subunit amino acid transport system substrate-binding protein